MVKSKITKSKKLLSKSTNVARKKRKIRYGITSGRIYIQSTFNNTIVTVTDDKGEVLLWSSAGSIGYKGTRKSTPYVASLVTKNVVDQIMNLGIKKVKVFVKGVGVGRDSAVRAIQGSDLDVLSLADTTPIPHNGCRPKKPRRV